MFFCELLYQRKVVGVHYIGLFAHIDPLQHSAPGDRKISINDVYTGQYAIEPSRYFGTSWYFHGIARDNHMSFRS